MKDKTRESNPFWDQIIMVLAGGGSLLRYSEDLYNRFTTIGTPDILRVYQPDFLLDLEPAYCYRALKKAHTLKCPLYMPADLVEDNPDLVQLSDHDNIRLFNRHEDRRPLNYMTRSIEQGLACRENPVIPMINLAFALGAHGVVLSGVDHMTNAEHKEYVLAHAYAQYHGFKISNANDRSEVRTFPFTSADQYEIRPERN